MRAASTVKSLPATGRYSWEIARDLAAVPSHPAIVYPSHDRRAFLR